MTGINKTTEKNLMVFTGRTHPELADAVAALPAPDIAVMERIRARCAR